MREWRCLGVSAVTLACAALAGMSCVPADAASGTLRLAAIFSDNMVLQRDADVPVWGWATPGATVTVRCAGRLVRGVADAHGKWITRLPPLFAGGPFELSVDCGESITLHNVMVGEVWLCSGQSNMEWPIGDFGKVMNYEEEIAEADHPDVRLFTVHRRVAQKPLADLGWHDSWRPCSPDTVSTFSAVAYFFGRELHSHMGVPVGLIHSSWGGTPAQSWTSEEALKALGYFDEALARMDRRVWDDPEEAARVHATEVAQWQAEFDRRDDGTTVGGRRGWADPGTDDSQWKKVSIPGLWESAGFPDLDGVGWYRKHFDVPDSWAGQSALLTLGALDDKDVTYLNGIEVGGESGLWAFAHPRRYNVPPSVIKRGRNTLAIRIADFGGAGGFQGKPEELMIGPSIPDGRTSISLAGEWRFRVGVDMRELPPRPADPNDMGRLAGLYNGMIAPLIPYAIGGVIWYQGESNAGTAYQYRSLFPAMIRDWRGRWKQGDFPFLFVQLANFMAVNPQPAESEWAELREAQLMTLSLPKTSMAVAIDIGDAANIHPKNKQDVGRRLALAARAIACGEKDLVYSGPIYRPDSMKVQGNHVRLQFDHVGGGLVAKGGELKGFAIAGEDRKFVWANAVIDGNAIVVSASAVEKPVAVRYAWANNPVCNLYNKEGLPASPFRTDSWPGLTQKAE